MQGTKALSINFKRLYDLRLGYGYDIVNSLYPNKNLFNDGIYLLNLIDKKYTKIINFKKIISPLTEINYCKRNMLDFCASLK